MPRIQFEPTHRRPTAAEVAGSLLFLLATTVVWEREVLAGGSPCGAPETGSCFIHHQSTEGCDDVACCETICDIDGFCCDVRWDGLCATQALSICLLDRPLCAGSAIEFQAAERAELAGWGTVAPNDEITIEFWQRLGTDSLGKVVECGSSNNNRIETITPDPGSDMIWFIYGAPGLGGSISVESPPGLSEGWHHFAFVASASGQFMRIHVDGELIASSGQAYSNGFIPADVPLEIGDEFAGAIDELRIWDHARTPTEIAADFDRTIPPDSPGLVLYYRMDDVDAGMILELSSASGLDHATLVGGPSLVFDGPCLAELDLCDGGSITCDGATAYIDVGTMGAFGAGVAQSTLEFWMRTDDTTSLASPIKIIDDRPGSGDPVYGIDLNRTIAGCTPSAVAPGQTLFFLRDNSLKVLAGAIDAPIYDGQWHHIAWRVMDSAANQMEVYVDGVLQPFVATCQQGPGDFTPWSDVLTLGAANNRGVIGTYLDGGLDEVRLFDHPRTPEEIAAHWMLEIDPATPGLVACWRLDEGGGELAFDYGSGNHGTLVGGPTWSGDTPCDPPSVVGDLNGDGIVDGADLGILLGAWGSPGPGDLDGSGGVDGADLGMLLGAWS